MLFSPMAFVQLQVDGVSGICSIVAWRNQNCGPLRSVAPPDYCWPLQDAAHSVKRNIIPPRTSLCGAKPCMELFLLIGSLEKRAGNTADATSHVLRLLPACAHSHYSRNLDTARRQHETGSGHPPRWPVAVRVDEHQPAALQEQLPSALQKRPP